MRRHRLAMPSHHLLAVAILLLCGLTLSGCRSGTNKAEAAPERRIETFVISPNSFVLLTDATPTIEVRDGTTIYTLVSEATVSFTPVQDAGLAFALSPNDIVIERPGIGTVTLIRSL